MDFRFRLYFSTNPTFKNPLQNHSSYLVEAVFLRKLNLKSAFSATDFSIPLLLLYVSAFYHICLLLYMPFTMYAFSHICLFPWPPILQTSENR